MNVIIAILALGLLIVPHEAGHFLMARWCGMRVYEFSIGFGPRIWFIKRGETEYSLRAIFLGGYVRVAGMHPAEEDAKEEGSFLMSAPWKRFLMIFAGPVANYITAIILFLMIFGGWGTRDLLVRVERVVGGSAAAQAGLKPGDKILSINGEMIIDRRPVTPRSGFWKLLQTHSKAGIVLTVWRNGRAFQVKLPALPNPNPKTLGLKSENFRRIRVTRVSADSLSARIGLKPGDQILSLGKKQLHEPFAFYRHVSLANAKFDLQVLRKGKSLRLLWPKQATGKTRDALGLKLRAELSLQISKVKPGGIAQAAGLQEGDLVQKVNRVTLVNKPAQSAVQLVQSWFAKCSTSKQPLKLKVLRDGKPISLKLKNEQGGCKADVVLRPTEWVLVMQTLPKSTARKIGLKPGDRIMAIDGQPINGFHHLLTMLRMRIYRPIKIELLRNHQRHTILAPVAANAKSWKLGFQPQSDFPRQRAGLLVSLRGSLWHTWRWNVRIWEGLSKIFRGREKAQFTGPVGIVQMAQRSVKQGISHFLLFVAVISIHLAFFNLLPIPALDGGRLMFLFTQQLLRLFGGKEELGVRIEMVANMIGFFLLFGLLIFITFKDILRLW